MNLINKRKYGLKKQQRLGNFWTLWGLFIKIRKKKHIVAIILYSVLEIFWDIENWGHQISLACRTKLIFAIDIANYLRSTKHIPRVRPLKHIWKNRRIKNVKPIVKKMSTIFFGEREKRGIWDCKYLFI